MHRARLLSCLVLVGCVGHIETGDPAAEVEVPPPFVDPQAGCALACHGTETSNAPPRSVGGASDPGLRAVGAHASHVAIAATFHRQVVCADCHVVPAEIGAPGHLDATPGAEVTFGAIAGPAPAWDGEVCTVACHGSVALGGAQTAPIWTRVDGTQSTCGSCHGSPPPPPHPADSNCATCHPTMEEGSLTFRDPARHIDGVIDVVDADATGGCTSCHGSPASAAPPRDLAGGTLPTDRGVGAHAVHLGASTSRRAIACASCHAVPLAIDAPGHLDGDDRAELRFDALNPAAIYDATSATCSNLYCHGTGRGNSGTAVWNRPGTLACGACHRIDGAGMSGDHRLHIAEEGLSCSACHAQVVDGNLGIVNANLHVNGVHEVRMGNGTYDPIARRCTNTGCHGTETW
jgi:predicted CxxxxCH...CXXCH cytochrome family protein